jgi:translation initiation factor 2B subunit (eIF-2B alpha/beta/delta family)
MNIIANRINHALYTAINHLPKHGKDLKETLAYLSARMQYEIHSTERDRAAIVRTFTDFINLFERPISLMTISFSSTILFMLRKVKNKLNYIYVSESRPLNEGTLLAQHLSNNGIKTHLITEAQIGYYMRNVDIVLLGADSVFMNGAIINKIGSFVMSVIANYYNKPIYVVCETNKVAPSRVTFKDEVLERKNINEIIHNDIKNIDVENIYFELVPSKLITSYLTEKGNNSKKDLKLLAQNFDQIVKEIDNFFLKTFNT